MSYNVKRQYYLRSQKKKVEYMPLAVILPGCICCIKRAGSTLHWVVRQDGTTEYLYFHRIIDNDITFIFTLNVVFN